MKATFFTVGTTPMLVFSTNTGKIYKAYSGPIAIERFREYITQKEIQNHLEREVQELTDWLNANPKHGLRDLKEQNRAYYLNRLVELDEMNLETINAN